MSRSSIARRLVLAWMAVMVGCACSQPVSTDVPPNGDALGAEVDELISSEAALEPSVTPLVAELSERYGGSPIGLAHRFKTRESILRKEAGRYAPWPASDISDALRYTIVIEDSPPGHHEASVHAILQALESEGHEVELVKNYWPRGDAYSGVNSVLLAPGSLAWELQFHTRDSYRTKQRLHTLYERMRLDSTPDTERKRLFDEMTGPWESVEIPDGILEPRRLHPKERIILRPRPGD